jgi:hypothetical protein
MDCNFVRQYFSYGQTLITSSLIFIFIFIGAKSVMMDNAP